jgi:hypothetical protein
VVAGQAALADSGRRQCARIWQMPDTRSRSRCRQADDQRSRSEEFGGLTLVYAGRLIDQRDAGCGRGR